MGDPVLGSLSTTVIDFENPAGWNLADKTKGVASVGSITAGSGYANRFAVTFSGGGGSGAAAYAIANAGAIQSITVTDAGSGYTSTPTVVLTAGGGTGGAATAVMGVVAAKQIAVLSNTLTPTQELIDNPSFRGDFNAVDPANGKKSASGQIGILPNEQLIAFIAKSMVGGGTQFVTSGGGPYTHTAKLGGNIPTSFVCENSFLIGGLYKYQKATGCRINQLTIPIDPVGFSPWTLDVMAADLTVGTTPYAASPTDWTAAGTPAQNLQLAAADVKIGGSAVGYIKKGSITLAANLSGDDYRVGAGGARGSLVPSRATVSGNLTLSLDANSYALVTAGSATSLSLKWTMGSGSFQLDLPRVFIQKTGPTLKDGGPVDVDVQIRGVYNSGDSTSIIFTVVNDQAGTVYA